MVSVSGPSTSEESVNDMYKCISGSEFDDIMYTQKDICILDCRLHGSPVKNATRVRLPNVLFRRLQGGTLPLTNISPRLVDENVRIVVIPEEESVTGGQSKVLLNALCKQRSRFIFVLHDDVDAMLSRFPQLREESAQTPSPTLVHKPDDLVLLNLNSLRIQGDNGPGLALTPMPKANDKRQTFPVQILPHLYLGNAETAENKELLMSYDIHYVVNVTSNLENHFEDDPRFRYLRISVDDNAAFNLTQFFPQAIAFIDDAERKNQGCLVHCLAGISRSVTVCLAYLMFTRHWSLEEAYDVVLGRNASIAPNFHFMGQLSDYERFLGITPKKSSVPRSPSCASESARPPSACLTPPPSSFPSGKSHFEN